mmetsp:Transcript_53619/g.135436  ORF Transcript_53619/g.135436 Transcript_53619/m.135436 type:complete len:230 (+) Transcript_53619:685-1374(+)
MQQVRRQPLHLDVHTCRRRGAGATHSGHGGQGGRARARAIARAAVAALLAPGRPRRIERWQAPAATATEGAKTAEAAEAAAATAALAAAFGVVGVLDLDDGAVALQAVDRLERGRGLFDGGEAHEAVSPVRDDLRGEHCAHLLEELLEEGLVGALRQLPDVEVVAGHCVRLATRPRADPAATGAAAEAVAAEAAEAAKAGRQPAAAAAATAAASFRVVSVLHLEHRAVA